MMATAAPYIAVMDADLQHDENRLPLMLPQIRDSPLDLVVASGYTEGGSVGEFSRAPPASAIFGRRSERRYLPLSNCRIR